jgi:hypothetical protein
VSTPHSPCPIKHEARARLERVLRDPQSRVDDCVIATHVDAVCARGAEHARAVLARLDGEDPIAREIADILQTAGASS